MVIISDTMFAISNFHNIKTFITLIIFIVLTAHIYIAGHNFNYVTMYLKMTAKYQSSILESNKTSSEAKDIFEERLLIKCKIRRKTLIEKVEINPTINESLEEIENVHLDMASGHYKPINCSTEHIAAIIIPFRDRDEHLKMFLYYILPMLKKQMIEFGIYVVQQDDNLKFNRGALMNIGFLEALKLYNYSCFIFHDVDLIPENEMNMYHCNKTHPRHMSVAVNTLNYKLPYATIFGGVTALTAEQFQAVNGFSNIFFGWGGEDDDLYNRIIYNGFNITRSSPEISRYHMIKHTEAKGNPKRFKLLQTGDQRYDTDGLNNVSYTLTKLENKSLYTLIHVKLGGGERNKNYYK